jgi:hypothetical protein
VGKYHHVSAHLGAVGIGLGWPVTAVRRGQYGGGAPVVGGGEEEVEEHQDDVEKLGVEAIGVEEGRRGVLHGEQKAAAGGDRLHTSGSRCGALGIQWRGRRASRGREESSWGIVMVRG